MAGVLVEPSIPSSVVCKGTGVHKRKGFRELKHFSMAGISGRFKMEKSPSR